MGKLFEGVEVVRLAQGGDGLGYLPDGRVVFVEGAVPGDVVTVELFTDKERWARGGIKELQERSEARREPGCKAFVKGCGGCQFWHVDADRELEWKVEAARGSLSRLSGQDLPESEVVAAPSVHDYRTRVTFHQREQDGEVVCGFFKSGTRQVVSVERCPVADPAIDEARQELVGVLGSLGAADITVETAGEGGAVVLIELKQKGRIGKPKLEELSRLVEQGLALRGVEIMSGDGEDYYIMGDTTVGVEEVLAYPPVSPMRVESGRFRQANKAINRQMVDYVREVVAESWDQPRILELFSGSGNFSFPLAQVAEALIGFESSEGAVETARQIAEISEEVEHVRFRVSDLSEPPEVSNALSEAFEVLVLDPPRVGADEVARRLAAMERGGQVIYVSCDIGCLGRDIKTLAAGGWSLERLRFFDLFPRTSHLEAVAVLEKGLG